MSFKRHLKTHERRKHAAKVLAAVPGITVLYAYYRKDKLTRGTYHQDTQRAYDYLAGKMHKAILWAARARRGSVSGRFGHVRHHDHSVTEAYLRSRRDTKELRADFQTELKWVAANTHTESQAADLYGGFLKAAVWEDDYGAYEGAYIKRVWRQIRQGRLCANDRTADCAIPLGLFSMPSNGLVTELDWFDCVGCRHKS